MNKDSNKPLKSFLKFTLKFILILALLLYLACGVYKIYRAVELQKDYNEFVQEIERLKGVRKNKLEEYYSEVKKNTLRDESVNYKDLYKDIYNIVNDKELIAKHLGDSQEKTTLSNLKNGISDKRYDKSWHVKMYSYYEGDGYYIIKYVNYEDDLTTSGEFKDYGSSSMHNIYLTKNDKQILSNAFSGRVTGMYTNNIIKLIDIFATFGCILSVLIILIITIPTIIVCSKNKTEKNKK